MISWFEKHYKLSFVITILIAIIIFYMSSLTGAQTYKASNNIQAVLYHIIVFFFLSFFLFISTTRGKNKGLLFPSILLSFFYSITDEFHQYFVPGRSSSISDIMLDSIGILFAFMIYFISIKYRVIKHGI